MDKPAKKLSGNQSEGLSEENPRKQPETLPEEKLESEVYRAAAASSDGIVINQHFGRADTFYIYEITDAGRYILLETRTVTPVCNMGSHNDTQLLENISRFEDCKYILASRIGIGAAGMIEQSGIIPMELPGIIGESFDKLRTYEQLQHLFV